jgi:hypothetical protein
MVSFTPRSLYPRCLLDRRLGGPQNRSARRGEASGLSSQKTRPLSSIGHPLAACTLERVCLATRMSLHGDRFIEPLPSNGSVHHNMYMRIYNHKKYVVDLSVLQTGAEFCFIVPSLSSVLDILNLHARVQLPGGKKLESFLKSISAPLGLTDLVPC